MNNNGDKAYYNKVNRVAKSQTGRMGAITPIQDMLYGLFPTIKTAPSAKTQADKSKEKTSDIYVGSKKLPKHIAELYHRYKDNPDMYPQLMELIDQTINPPR